MSQIFYLGPSFCSMQYRKQSLKNMTKRYPFFLTKMETKA